MRFDWSPTGAEVVSSDVNVIVDVLSFSTSVCVAVERGVSIYPFRWNGVDAEAFAQERDAVLAVGRLEATAIRSPSVLSLSPSVLLKGPVVPRLVLPSPNGSTITSLLAKSGASVVAGCLRNAAAVSDWLASQLERGDSVSIIAAGERWRKDDSLRPAFEDQIGAGAILSGFSALGYRSAMSPEASSSAALFDAVRPRLDQVVHECVSARELEGMGFGCDVEIAQQLNASWAVPLLADGAFRAAT